jgi:hypothetical protein
MSDTRLREEVRRLRAAGRSPKEIARTLGVRPAAIAPLVREMAVESAAHDQGELAGCWISPAWSRDLLVPRREGWDDTDLGPGGPAGIALVLVARANRHDRVIACGYLVDTFCLGVKNTIGPQRLHRRDLPGFVRSYFGAFPAPPLRAPLELAQHVVHGAVAFAAALGFEPHPDFRRVRAHLGELSEPCAITFGQRGRPLYVAGPHDDPVAVMRRLRASIGSGEFTVAA